MNRRYSGSWAGLVEAEIVYQRGVPPQSTYVFKHALIQDAAYESLLKSTGSNITNVLHRSWKPSSQRR